MREFETGATRDRNESKLNYAGFLSPAVLRAYAQYMQKHRVQNDGKLREADNWKKGMPLSVWRESLARHFMTAWLLWDGESVEPDMVAGKEEIPTELDALMGILFNAMGLAHALLKKQGSWGQWEARQQAAHEQRMATFAATLASHAGDLTPPSPPPSHGE